ncbi:MULTISPECIES: hypothetical protein [unclassified Caballeronia]|uniref:hypothetical protein n=1 Tax=unclassified Caballeronia TaxID=2646786 RepID=UPI00202790D5|nr:MULTISPECIES: hypothetical protein [unclassified Caballeronia]
MSSIARKLNPKPALFEKWGTFGRFQTGMSYPIEYILTTFAVSELQHLTLAQDLSPSEPDFELLMQRDIDVDRVDKQIIKYLSPEKTEAELRTRPTFFPPLLAAIIPLRGREMLPYLPAEVREEAMLSEDGDAFVRSWGKLVRMTYYVNRDGDGSFEFEKSPSNAGTGVSVDAFPVRIQIKKFPEYGNDDGIGLVVIDGQHRLSAIRKLATMSPELLKQMVVPVCLIIAPQSTEAREADEPSLTLPISRVFRELFVDVNKNAVAVGGHFNLLLADSDIGKLAVRVFCEQVLHSYQKEGLALVEWNVRSVKDATQITRRYSLTSIGVIELALMKAIGNKAKSRGLMKRLLSLGLVEPQLYPAESGYDYPKPIEWDRFSPAQKLILEDQIRIELIKKGLLRIFFEPEAFRTARTEFMAVVNEYREFVNKKENFEAASAVLQHVLEYRPIPDSNNVVRAELKKFGDTVGGRYEANTNGIIRYSIFQRAMIHAWLELVDFLRNRDDISLDQITSGFIALLDFCLKRERGLFSDRSRYMSHSIFKVAGVIKPSEGTRGALTALIHACLGNRDVLREFVEKLGVASEDRLYQELFDFGFSKATVFATHYRTQRRDEFIASWVTDFRLPQDERDELQQLQERHESVRKNLRDKKATKGEALAAESAFLACVNRHVGTEVELATKDLRDALGYDVEIVLDNTLDGSEEEE